MNYFNLNETGANVQMALQYAIELKESAVVFSPNQSLSSENQENARANIGAVSQGDIAAAITPSALSPVVNSIISSRIGTNPTNLATVSYVINAQASYPQFIYVASTASATAHNAIYVIPGEDLQNELWVCTTDNQKRKIAISQNQNLFFNSFVNAFYYNDETPVERLNLDWDYYSVQDDDMRYFFIPKIPSTSAPASYIQITQSNNPWTTATTDPSYPSKNQNWRITEDINFQMADYDLVKPVTNYFNTLDGQGHTITLDASALGAIGTWNGGLFSCTSAASSGTIKIKNLFIRLIGSEFSGVGLRMNTTSAQHRGLLVSVQGDSTTYSFSAEFENVHFIVDGSKCWRQEITGTGLFGLFMAKANEISFKNCSICWNINWGRVQIASAASGWAGGFIGSAIKARFENCISTIEFLNSPAGGYFGGFFGSLNSSTRQLSLNKTLYYYPDAVVSTSFYEYGRVVSNMQAQSKFITQDCYYTHPDINNFTTSTAFVQDASPNVVPQYPNQLAVNTNEMAQYPLWVATGFNSSDWVKIKN